MRNLFRGALLACGISLALPAAADVFINEIHYDTPGSTDANETVEVVATGGEDLANYRIQLYNGNGGAPYGTVVTLPSGATVTCGSAVRIATYNFTANGGQIQNGAPDGIALIGPGDAVIQFLSYEGQMTAVGGFADGIVSQDIGVAEDNAGNLGESLQLSGSSGTTYADFTWQGEATATFGACNNGQTFGTPVDNPPQLTASTPANGASGVAVGSPIALTFSEAVTTTDPWFVLDCGAGAVAGTLSGSGNTRSFDPTADLPFNTSCTVTLTAANIVDTDGSADALTGTASFSFTTAADLAPSVTSVSPIENATGVNINANLSVTFSEPVTPTLPNWLALSCTNSGAHPVTIGGGPTTWTINPDADFDFSETCTATIAAANVQDQDGLPDPMAAPKIWSFTTSADLAPTVMSTTPADGALNVALAADLTIVFSETVNATSAAFAISCATSGGHALTLSASPATSFTLNPDTDFAANESCTVTVTAALVTDTDGTATPMAVDYVFDFTTGTDPDDYYAGVDASSCTALRTTLHDKIDDHTGFPYSTTGTTITDTWDILVLADQNPLNSTEILEVYENAHYPKAVAGNANFNKEHTWPNSYGFNNLDGYTGSVPQSSAFSDTHMLYLSDITYNSNRGSKPYADCPDTDGCTPDATLNYNGVGGGPVIYASGNHNWKKTSASGEAYGSYEVWNHRKGDMARAVLYMDIRYEGGTATGGNTVGQSEPDLVVTDDRNLIDSRRSTASGTAYMGLKSTLLAWHVADPPDEQERLRNGVIFSFQGNRNPFIDHPEWVECLFSCNCTVAPPDDIFENGFE